MRPFRLLFRLRRPQRSLDRETDGHAGAVSGGTAEAESIFFPILQLEPRIDIGQPKVGAHVIPAGGKLPLQLGQRFRRDADPVVPDGDYQKGSLGFGSSPWTKAFSTSGCTSILNTGTSAASFETLYRVVMRFWNRACWMLT